MSIGREDRGAGGEGLAGAGKPLEGDQERTAPLRLLAFGLGDEWYAIESSYVRSIEPETEITPVPWAPVWLLGVFNLRGTILPAVDPRPLFGLSRREGSEVGLLIVFRWDDGVAALQVDAVDEMYEVSTSSLEPLLATTGGARPDVIAGQVKVRDRLIGVVNVAAFARALLND